MMHNKIYRLHKHGVSLREISEMLSMTIENVREQYKLGGGDFGSIVVVEIKKNGPENYKGKETVYPWGVNPSRRYLLRG